MARDTLAEIAAIKGRGGRIARSHSSALTILRFNWEAGDLTGAIEYVPIRLVTILEVFTQTWLAEIVDAGEPYVTGAANLTKNGVKIDYAVAHALLGKKVTLGELIAHVQSVNQLDNIYHCFTTVLGQDLWGLIVGVVDRWKVERMGQAPDPIIGNLEEVRRVLVDLFETRHILVHELARKQNLDQERVVTFIDATERFVEACDEAFHQLLYGPYPLTQLEMNEAARAGAEKADATLAEVLAQLDPDGTDKDLQTSQRAWLEYRDWQAAFRSGINRPAPGSIAPALAADERAVITLERINQLRWYLEREEGDL